MMPLSEPHLRTILRHGLMLRLGGKLLDAYLLFDIGQRLVFLWDPYGPSGLFLNWAITVIRELFFRIRKKMMFRCLVGS